MRLRQSWMGLVWLDTRVDRITRSVLSQTPALAAAIIKGPKARGSCVVGPPRAAFSRKTSSEEKIG